MTPEPCVVVNNSSVTEFIGGVFTAGKILKFLTSIIFVAKSEYTPSLFLALTAMRYCPASNLSIVKLSVTLLPSKL